MLPLDQFIEKFNHSTYKLDLSGAVGILGGNNAVEAIETIHLFAGRRWAGWYNYPGALTVARKFGQMANSQFWDSLFPGPNESPAITFNLAGKSGPEYSGALSGTKLKQTKHMGYLMAQECAKSPGVELKLTKKSGEPGRKTGSSAAVTVISLPPKQHNRILESCREAKLSDEIKKKHGHIPIHSHSVPLLALVSIVPSLVSILACAFCILGRDFLCASLILFGIICSGISSVTLGTAMLKIHVPVPSPKSPRGDGLLFLADGSVIVLKGEEADVNIVTKGEFKLDFSHGILRHEKHHMIGVCCLLLMTQFLAQLLLIPLCTLFGQIVFLLSFFASEAYHLYVVSHERDKVQREVLFQELSPDRVDRWELGTRTQMAVLLCLFLGDIGQRSQVKHEELLKRIIPNDTPVWETWRGKVLKELVHFWESDSSSYEPSIRVDPEPKESMESEKSISLTTDEDKELSGDLVDDAWGVFMQYPEWRRSQFQREQPLKEKSRLLSAICLA